MIDPSWDVVWAELAAHPEGVPQRRVARVMRCDRAVLRRMERRILASLEVVMEDWRGHQAQRGQPMVEEAPMRPFYGNRPFIGGQAKPQPPEHLGWSWPAIRSAIAVERACRKAERLSNILRVAGAQEHE